MKKAATLFSGFDGAGEGTQAAGFEIIWGIELEDKIAQVARDNGHPVVTANILDCDPHDFEKPDALHASPPCTRASVANSSAEENEEGLKESALDIALAMKTVEFIEVLKPRIVTIENVWGYRKFQSFKGGKKCEGILPALERMGYWINVQHCNSADFGVPQTRRRLILRAVLGGWVPQLPEPEPWVGWYEAIEDLIPTLPESEFAPRQLDRLPQELKQSCLCDMMFNASRDFTVRPEEEPAYTIFANHYRRESTVPRAFLVNTREMHGNDGAPYTAVDMRQPCNTVAASSEANRHKAFVINGDNTIRDLTVCAESDPFWTVQSNIGKAPPRAWLSQGRVVKMTPRALARFQSFSDSYKLPDNNALVCKGIGNAVPPLMFKKIYTQLKDCA